MFFSRPSSKEQHDANIASKPERRAAARLRLWEQDIKHETESYNYRGVHYSERKNIESKQLSSTINDEKHFSSIKYRN